MKYYPTVSRNSLLDFSLKLQSSHDHIKKIQKIIFLETAFAGFLVACEARALSAHTIEDYSRTIRMFIAYVGDIPMQDITVDLITGFLASVRRRGVGEKTVLNRHIGLAAFWTWALKNDIVGHHIVRQVEKPKPPEIIIEPLTESEVRVLLNEVRRNPDRDRAIIYLLLDTGLRASELVSLDRGEIDMENHRIIVKKGKGNKDRKLPFCNKTASVLAQYLNNCTDRKPFNIKRRSLTDVVFRLGLRSGVRNVHPHRFRHTFAINYMRNGGDVFTLQKLLGHTTMEMVKRYLHIVQTDIDRAHHRASPVENWDL
ncbi:MAG: tyrosine-type recombinase/integrase [Anaerolineales bacterium]|nr:MAG: tyrosine-type recombinase/integrase [Anaerolineales bacterium]